jgi:hypothetical protein
MALFRVPGFSKPVLLMFCVAGLFVVGFGFWAGQLLIVLGGTALILGYLGFGVMLGSYTRFLEKKELKAKSTAPAWSYLVTAIEAELAVLLLSAAVLLIVRLFMLPA